MNYNLVIQIHIIYFYFPQFYQVKPLFKHFNKLIFKRFCLLFCSSVWVLVINQLHLADNFVITCENAPHLFLF